MNGKNLSKSDRAVRNSSFSSSEELPAAPKSFYSAEEQFSGGSSLLRSFLHRDYSIGMHAHDFIEINLVSRGIGRHFMLDHSFEVKAGDVFVIPPHFQHAYVSEKNLDVQHILLHETFIKKFEFELKSLPGYLMLFTVEPYFRLSENFRYILKLSQKSQKHVFPLLDSLNELSNSDSYGKDREMESISLCVITHLCLRYEELLDKSLPPSSGAKAKLQAINAAVNLMRKRFAEKITLEQLAKVAGAQREYFCREFRKSTGYSPMAYLTQIRVDEAKKRLLENNESISTIALRTGFYDSSHFSKVFKKETGLSPRAFQVMKD